MGLGGQRLSGSVEPFPCRNLCGRGSPQSRPFLPHYSCNPLRLTGCLGKSKWDSASPSLPFCGMELAPIQGAFWPFWGSPSIIPFLQVKRLCWHSLQSSELSFHTISLLQRVVSHFIVILVSLYCAWYIAFDIHRMGLWLFLYCIKILPQGKLCPSVAVDWANQNLTFGGSMDRQQAAYTSTVLWYRVGPKLLPNNISSVSK